ncbi:MAG: hypothetical protein Q9199_005545 [Rusavskia elegans]
MGERNGRWAMVIERDGTVSYAEVEPNPREVRGLAGTVLVALLSGRRTGRAEAKISHPEEHPRSMPLKSGQVRGDRALRMLNHIPETTWQIRLAAIGDEV